MAKFTIPRVDGQRVSTASATVTDASNTFGNKIEEVIAPVMPTAEVYGKAVADAEIRTGQAITDAGLAAGQQIEAAEKREKLLQQAEERTKAKLELANTDAAWEETKIRLSQERYEVGQTAEEYQQSLVDAKDELGYNASLQSKYKTTIGDDFNNALDMRLNKYNMEVIKEGGLVEDYRLERVRSNVSELSNVIRQTSAANGTYDAAMNARNEIELLHSEESNVQAMGGLDNAVVNKLNAINDVYTDQIHLAMQNNENLESVHNLLTVKSVDNENEFMYYPDLNPKVRADFIKRVEAAKRLRKKLAKDKAWYTGILEHGRKTGRIPSLADPRYKKMVNAEYQDTFLESVAKLPTNERYAETRRFIKDTQIMPANLKTEISMTFQSNDPSEVKSSIEFASDLMRDNPRMQKELPKDLVQATIMHQAGMTIDNVVKTMEINRNMPEQQKNALKTLWKHKDTKETTLKSLQSYTSEMGDNPALAGEYESLYKQNFIKTLGDAETAKALTENALNNVWGVTTLGSNERPMKYAPERLVPNAGDWMHTQLTEDAMSVGVDLQGKDFYLVPTERTIKTGKPEYMVMVVDEQTGFANPIIKDNVRQLFTFDYAATNEAKQMKVDKNYKYYNAAIQATYAKQLNAWKQLPYNERNKMLKPQKPAELETPDLTPSEENPNRTGDVGYR